LFWVALLGIVLTGSLPKKTFGDCIDYGTFIHQVGSASGQTDYTSMDVALYGNYAYVTGTNSLSYVGSVFVFDISNPTSPSLVNTVELSRRAFGLAVSGSYLYVANDYDGLKIYSLSIPTSPVLVGTMDTPNEALDVVVSGPHAFVADWGSGLQVIDISSPGSPSIVGSVDTPGLANGIDVPGLYGGSLVLVADEANGLEAIDVSNPGAPAIVGSLNTPVNAQGVAVSGNYAYVVDDEFGLRIVDITNAASMALVGSVRTARPEGVTVDGSRAFVAGQDFEVVDISDPSSPAIVGGVQVASRAVAVSGSYAFAADYHGVAVIDVSAVVDINNPSSPPFLGNVETYITDVTVSGSYAYVAALDFKVIDISDPGAPTVVGTVGFPFNQPAGVAVSGSYAYVTDPYGYDPESTQSGRLRIIDISNPASPTQVGSVHSTGGKVWGPASGIAVSGDYVYVACPDENDPLTGPGSLQVIDVSKPTRPSTVATVPVPEFPCYSIATSGPYAYVTGFKETITTYPVFSVTRTTGVRVIDISSPWTPVMVGGLTLTSPPNSNTWYQVVAAGNYLYVAGSPALQVIDVSDPTAPAIVATYLGNSRDLAVQGSNAYLIGGTEIRVVDIQNPLSPTTKGVGYLSGGTRAVTANSSYLFVGGDLKGDPDVTGLFIYPLQCPAVTPVRLSSFVAFPQSNGIALKWATSSEADFSGFHVHRSTQADGGYERLTRELVRPGANYSFLDTEVTAGITYYYRLEALDRTGNREFFGPVSARMDAGSAVGMMPTLGLAFPNPVHVGSTTIPFALASAGKVRIRVLDLAGREVVVLLDELAEPGEHSVLWDGRNKQGETVPAGIYLYQIQTSAFEATRKLVRLR
jgi:hypothetical protein